MNGGTGLVCMCYRSERWTGLNLRSQSMILNEKVSVSVWETGKVGGDCCGPFLFSY